MGILTETDKERDERYMRMAMEEAMAAFDEGEVPIGAVVVVGDRVAARTHNRTEALRDVTAHAEMLALTAAEEHLNGKYLPQCTLYVTVEPCCMCAGALGWSQIGRIVYGAQDEKRGFHTFYEPPRGPLHPQTRLQGGVLAEECAAIMKKFFSMRR